VRLLTMPRILGYAFNPLSVYFCHGSDGALRSLVYEVRNTFGERHSYAIAVEAAEGHAPRVVQRCAKAVPGLAVPVDGPRLRLPDRAAASARAALSIGVVANDAAGALVNARFDAQRRRLDDAALARVFLSHPLLTIKVIAAIHWEALRLFVKGVRLSRSRRRRLCALRPRAPPTDERSALPPRAGRRGQEPRRRASRPDHPARLAAAAPAGLAAARRRLRIDRDRAARRPAARGRGPLPGPHAAIQLHRWRSLGRLVLAGDIGLAESYRDGDWTTPDLSGGARVRHPQRGELGRRAGRHVAGALAPSLLHAARANTRRGSRRNIAFHYDLGNEFYAQWLDPELIYSSAIYADPAQPLEERQAAKLDRIGSLLRLDGLGDGARVLEIGCGWGALALRLAKRHGAHLTGITLSGEQLAHAQARVEREGAAAQVELRLQDYRDVRGRFDRIVSIEMLEAVGERYWPVYFETLRDRLAPAASRSSR
jgi:hypothetical protein